MSVYLFAFCTVFTIFFCLFALLKGLGGFSVNKMKKQQLAFAPESK